MDHPHFTGYYRSPEGRTKSAGTYPSKRAALRAAGRLEHKVVDGSWIDPALGQITFRQYVWCLQATRWVAIATPRFAALADGPQIFRHGLFTGGEVNDRSLNPGSVEFNYILRSQVSDARTAMAHGAGQC